MRIFDKKQSVLDRFLAFMAQKDEESPQVEILDPAKKRKYDVAAALSKALLVFMLSYGAVAGFLSAFDLDFNRLLCAVSLAAMALLLALIYETEKKWFTNLCVIGIFIVYAYVAVSRFWILNSGAYAVINQIYEYAQAYLGVVGGGLYNLSVDDSYRTITAIALFVGVVLEILFAIRLQYKASILRTVLLTFTLYLIPIYLEQMPDLLSFFLLLAGYATITIVQLSGVKGHISAQIKRALPIGAAASALLILVLGILLPRQEYRLLIPKNPAKAASEEEAVFYAQYGLMAVFANNVAGGGINAGKLSQNTMVMPNDETHLIVRFTPYSMEPVYLKAFTGLRYDGEQWSNAVSRFGTAEDKTPVTLAGRKQLYERSPELQSRGVMEVVNVGAREEFDYRPYYTDPETVQPLNVSSEEEKSVTRYEYYPIVTEEEVLSSGGELVSTEYLDVPKICRDAVETACKKAGLHGTPEEIVQQVADFFEEEYAYTLRPGYYFGNLDYISYFLSKNKKGYCTHFASAGTMLFRYMGIPARYVEGYVFSYTDVVTDGEIVEDAEYEDFYQGYAPLGKTALIEMEVPDGQGHAWVEIYVKGKGWIPVDVTPAASMDDEETGAFWENFLNRANIGEGPGQQQTTAQLSETLENALAGGAGILGVIAAAAVLFFLIRRIREKMREAKLPPVERIRLEYSRVTGPLKEKSEEFAGLTTPKEELDWIRLHVEGEMPAQIEQDLYETFFAPAADADFEKLRNALIRLQKQVRKGKYKL